MYWDLIKPSPQQVSKTLLMSVLVFYLGIYKIWNDRLFRWTVPSRTFMPIKDSEMQSSIDDYSSAIFEQSPISIQIMSPDGYTVQVNKAWEELWEWRLNKLRNTTYSKTNNLLKIYGNSLRCIFLTDVSRKHLVRGNCSHHYKTKL